MIVRLVFYLQSDVFFGAVLLVPKFEGSHIGIATGGDLSQLDGVRQYWGISTCTVEILPGVHHGCSSGHAER